MLDPAKAGMDRRDFLGNDIFARQNGSAGFGVIARRECRCQRILRSGVSRWLFASGEVPAGGEAAVGCSPGLSGERVCAGRMSVPDVKTALSAADQMIENCARPQKRTSAGTTTERTCQTRN